MSDNKNNNANKDASNRIEWLNHRIDLKDCGVNYIEFQLQEAFKAGMLANEANKEQEQALSIKRVVPRFLEEFKDSVALYYVCPVCEHKPILAYANHSNINSSYYCDKCQNNYKIP